MSQLWSSQDPIVGYIFLSKETINGKDLIIPSVWSKNEIEPKPFTLFSSNLRDPIELGYL